MNRHLVVIDIETVANDRSPEYYSRKKYQAPVNYKDPDKIANYVMEARHNDQVKSALSWWTGKIICVGMRSLHNRIGPVSVRGDDEAKILQVVFDYFTKLAPCVVIGKSADVFDKPFLIGRAMASKIGIPAALRPFRPIEDVDHIFGFSASATQRGSLNDYAFGLGIPQKTGHGTSVQTWYNEAILGDAGKWDTIEAYCSHDVDITAEILRRWETDFVPSEGIPVMAGPTSLDKAIEVTF